MTDNKRQFKEFMAEHKFFKVNQSVVLRNGEGKILILRQPVQPDDSSHSGGGATWTLPGGRMEEGETPEEGLRREIFEETGIKDVTIEKPISVHISDSGNSYIIAFLARTNETAVQVSHEHNAFAWIAPDEIDQYPFGHEHIKSRIRTALQK